MILLLSLSLLGAAINYERPTSSCPIQRYGFTPAPGEHRPGPNSTNNSTNSSSSNNSTNVTQQGGFFSSVMADPIDFILGLIGLGSAVVSIAGGVAYLGSRDQVRSTRTQRAVEAASDIPTPSGGKRKKK